MRATRGSRSRVRPLTLDGAGRGTGWRRRSAVRRRGTTAMGAAVRLSSSRGAPCLPRAQGSKTSGASSPSCDALTAAARREVASARVASRGDATSRGACHRWARAFAMAAAARATSGAAVMAGRYEQVGAVGERLLGVATRAWSPVAAGGPDPRGDEGDLGVPTSARTAATSCGEQTIAPAPAPTRARRAGVRRRGRAERGPRTRDPPRRHDVRTVTAATSCRAARPRPPPAPCRAAGGVDGEERRAQARDRAGGAGHGVGDVVQLQVEEHVTPLPPRTAVDRGGAVAQEELEPDLDVET